MRKHVSMISLIAVLLALVVAGCVGAGDSDTSGGGIAWVKNDLTKGLEQARSEQKKIFLYFGAGY